MNLSAHRGCYRVMVDKVPSWKSLRFVGIVALIALMLSGGGRTLPGHLALGVVGLVAILFRDLGTGQAVAVGSFPNRGGLISIAALAMFALGSWIGSDTAQIWGVSLLFAWWIWSAFRGVGAFPLLLLLGLICLPQGVLEDTLLLRMQRSAAGFASWVLDTQRIPHVPKGAVIETAKGVLFVEEACSGMISLLTGLIVTQIYFAWNRMGFWSSVVGLMLSSVLLFAGNCLRIVMVAVAYSKWEMDWTSGWRHEVSGLMVYLLVLSLLPSLRQLILTVSRGFIRWRYPWVGMDPQAQIEDHVGESGGKDALARVIRSFPTSAAWATGGMIVVTVLAWFLFVVPETKAEPSDWPSLRETEMTRNVNGWILDPAGREVSFLKKWSLNHQVWLYRKGARKAWISADLPFEAVHRLPNCYSMRDWRILRSEPVQLPDTDPLSVMELKSQGEGGSLLVLFSNFDLYRSKFVEGIPSRLEERWDQFTSRLMIGAGEHARRSGAYCQIQLVLDGGDAMESETGRDALLLFKEVRRDLVSKLRGSPGGEGKGDR